MNSQTRLVDLTIGELEEWIKTITMSKEESREKRYVYGISGIMDLFGCSESTARRLKNGKIREAVNQSGRTIVTDVDKAMELFKN